MRIIVAGPQTGTCDIFDSYERFYQAYLQQAVSALEDQLEITRSYDDYYLYMNPVPMFSATIKNSLIEAFDAYAGGSPYNTSGIMISPAWTISFPPRVAETPTFPAHWPVIKAARVGEQIVST